MNQTTPHCILVVEDDAPSRTLLVRRLQREGWQTREAADGHTALELLATASDIAAVLLDIGLPGMDGISALERIRRNHASNDLPVIMVTAFDEENHLASAMEAGANDYVNKPISFPTLRARLHAHLAVAKANRELQNLKERQALILHGSNDGVWEWNMHEDHIAHSARLFELLSLPFDPMPGHSERWFARIHPDDRPRVRKTFEAFRDDPAAEFFRSEYRIITGGGRYIWLLTRGAAQRDRDGQCLRCAGTHTDVSALRYINRHTELPNLQYLTDELNHQLREARNGQQSRLIGLVFLRLADMGAHFDRAGTRYHLIRQLAEALQQLPDCELIANGEHPEHLILLPKRTAGDTYDFEHLAQRGLASARAGVATPSGRVKFPANAGIGCFTSTLAHSANEIIGAGRLAAHDAYANDQDICLFDARLAHLSNRRQQISEALPDAVEEGAIVPWWQPIIGAGSQLAGFETLARWHHGDDYVPPFEFVPLAESAGLMPQLTEHVLEQTLAALSSWQRAGLVSPQTYMAVNFPPTLLNPQRLPERLLAMVARHGLSPQNLCVEVTESNAVTDLEEVQLCLQRLADAGFQLALDDFGTGYASLNTLHRLPFDTLKIDQSFVSTMDEQPGVRKLIHAIIAIAQALGLKLVAEGVETQEQARSLRAAGVDRLQGYLLARPMPERALLQWLQQRATVQEVAT